MKKHVSLIMCALLLLSMISGALVSCADDSADPAGTSAEAAPDTTTEPETEGIYDENGYIKDKLGNPDYKGTTFTLFYWSDVEHEEFEAENENGEAVNDAIFRRNARVADRTGITLEFASEKGNSDNYKNFTDKLQASIESGLGYDMVGAYSPTAGNCAVKGLFYDLNSCENFEWEMPWWPENLMKQAVIKNRLYFASGDISANLLYMMYVTFFNKSIADNRGLDDPYALVENNQWTLDKMLEMCSGIYEDSDNSNTPTIGDLFGQYAYTLHIDAYIVGSGITFLSSENGELILNPDFTGEKTITLMDKLNTFFKDKSCAYLLTESNSNYQWFAQNKSLFWTDRCRNAIHFKDAETSFGVVPVPKGSSDQEKFSTVIGNPFTLYALPSDVENPAMASAVMEIYASESYRQISPVLYDTTLKYRYTDDATSAKMFDLIRSTVSFDLGRIFSKNFGAAPYKQIENTIQAGNSWKTAATANMKTTWPKALQNILTAFGG